MTTMKDKCVKAILPDAGFLFQLDGRLFPLVKAAAYLKTQGYDERAASFHLLQLLKEKHHQAA